MDLLSNVLQVLRLQASVFFHNRFCGAWSVDTSGSGKGTFHLIARGNCWLHRKGQAPVPLRGGDLIVFPRDAEHMVSNSAEPPALPEPEDACDTASPSTTLICGYFEFDAGKHNPVLEALPEFLHIRGDDVSEPWLEPLMRFIVAETEGGQPGSDVTVNRLSEVLFIQTVRAYIRDVQPGHGFLAALQDRRINQALRAVHENPGETWSVARMAAVAGMSRAAFAALFSRLLESSPMQYVTQWRMQLAHESLLEGKQSVAAIAETAGYRSEVAFRKAFKQTMGIGPGAVRRSRGAAA